MYLLVTCFEDIRKGSYCATLICCISNFCLLCNESFTIDSVCPILSITDRLVSAKVKTNITYIAINTIPAIKRPVFKY